MALNGLTRYLILFFLKTFFRAIDKKYSVLIWLKYYNMLIYSSLKIK